MGGQILHPAFIPFFFLFRLIYIPASVLSHTGHGSPWLNAVLGCVVTLGAEWLTRRIGVDIARRERQRAVVVVIMALVTLGFFPEEAPIGLILWAGSGAAWGAATRGFSWRATIEHQGGFRGRERWEYCWERRGCSGRGVGWGRLCWELGCGLGNRERRVRDLDFSIVHFSNN